MVPVHVYLGLILTTTLSVLSEDDETTNKITGGFMGYIKGNKFNQHEFLPDLEKPLRYSFIIVKHSMVPPECGKGKTFPSDQNYQAHWTPGTATKAGRCLMNMVGKSLSIRYSDFLESLSWNEIKISSMNKPYAKRLAADLGFGLLGNTKHKAQQGDDLSWVFTKERYEKITNLIPLSQTKCRWLKTLVQALEMDIKRKNIYFTRCMENLYETLGNYIMESKNKEDWKMDSPQSVYKLWTLLVFETLQGEEVPSWVKDEWSRIQSCVFEYHRALTNYHTAIPALFSGRLIEQMQNEMQAADGQVKFHIHVTDDIGVLNMNWSLPNSQKDYWPDYGDVIMFDFFTDQTVQAMTFSGWLRNLYLHYKGTAEEFFKDFKKVNVHLTEDEWNAVCNYDGQSQPPRGMDPLLFENPQSRKLQKAKQINS